MVLESSSTHLFSSLITFAQNSYRNLQFFYRCSHWPYSTTNFSSWEIADYLSLQYQDYLLVRAWNYCWGTVFGSDKRFSIPLDDNSCDLFRNTIIITRPMLPANFRKLANATVSANRAYFLSVSNLVDGIGKLFTNSYFSYYFAFIIDSNVFFITLNPFY